MDKPFFIVNVEAAIFKQDKWLIAERSMNEDHAAGSLAFVGGKVENVDTANNVLEETLKREVLEEVGVEIDNIQYVKSSSFVAQGVHVIDIVFLCEYKSGEPAALQPDEIASVSWMTLDEIMSNEKIETWTKESLIIADPMRLQCQDKIT